MRRLLGLAALALLCVARPASADLLVNGGFETGDFTGWLQQQTSTNTGVTGTFLGVNPAEGTKQAYLGQTTAGFLRQAKQITTVVGQQYTLSFMLANLAPGNNLFRAKFGDTYALTLSDAAAFAYTSYSLVVTATDTKTILGFVTKNVPSYFLLDKVKLVKGVNAVPEPSSFALLGAGAFSLGLWVIRRRKAA